jgi:hypothetical protein
MNVAQIANVGLGIIADKSLPIPTLALPVTNVDMWDMPEDETTHALGLHAAYAEVAFHLGKRRSCITSLRLGFLHLFCAYPKLELTPYADALGALAISFDTTTVEGADSIIAPALGALLRDYLMGIGYGKAASCAHVAAFCGGYGVPVGKGSTLERTGVQNDFHSVLLEPTILANAFGVPLDPDFELVGAFEAPKRVRNWHGTKNMLAAQRQLAELFPQFTGDRHGNK